MDRRNGASRAKPCFSPAAWTAFGILYAAVTVGCLCAPIAARADTFDFVALGDTTYQIPRDYAPYERLIETINGARPAFTIHVGDIKGYFDCGDDVLATIGRFDLYNHPVIYTPGDNEWTDCSAEATGGYDPLDRLAALRRMFFASPSSLGARTIPLTRQSAGADYRATPENVRWAHEGVIFATVHVVGPDNNFRPFDRSGALDAMDRIAAARSWIEDAFRIARADASPALVLAFHIDPFSEGAAAYEGGPVHWLIDTIRTQAPNFAGQILLVHGDGHRLEIDQPMRRIDPDAGTVSLDNITRLHVFGWPHDRAVRVSVNTETPWIFSFAPIYPRGQ